MGAIIRPATAEDLAIFPEIEQSAGLAFRGSSQDALADGDNRPAEFYAPLQRDGLALVAEDAGVLLGFAAAEAFPDALHLWELAVLHQQQQRGLGRRLVEATIALAQRRGSPAVTLTTFRDLPWNAPFYGTFGFIELDRKDVSPRLRAVLADEASHGLDPAARCAMRLAL